MMGQSAQQQASRSRPTCAVCVALWLVNATDCFHPFACLTLVFAHTSMIYVAFSPQMREPEAPPDGTPLFYLYARNPKTRVMWYPVSMLRGDQQSKGLISAWLGSPIGTLLTDSTTSALELIVTSS